MAKTAAILVLSFLFFWVGGDRYIPWGTGYKLTWDDFSGEVDESSTFEAHTYSKISFSWDREDGKLIFDAVSKFDKERSWKRDRLTANLLAHEQLHFDLTEVYARKMREHFATLKNAVLLSNEEIAAQGEEILAEWREREDQYDEETDHSKDKAEQARWASMVAGELKALSKYALQAMVSEQ